MSECDCGIDFKHKLTCGQGKELMHVETHEEKMQNLAQELADVRQELIELQQLREKERREEAETMNHLRVAQSQHQVQLTLRGKSKMFTPQAIKHLIAALDSASNGAENYAPPVMIHCSHGRNTDELGIRLIDALRK